MTVKEENIMLGSGDLFIGVVPDVATATETQISAALTKVGLISGGAALTYSPNFVDVKAGNRIGTIASFMTDEEMIFKSGLLTWDLANIEKLSAAHYSEDTTAGTRRIGIGGLKSVPINYLRFVHTKPDGKKLTLNIFKAQAQSGFELNFDKENPTVLDAEFKVLAVPGKTNGNLVEIIEEVGATPVPDVDSISKTSITVASQPTIIVVTGSGFTPDSVVIKDNLVGLDVDFRTFYDSPTQLTAEVIGLSAGTHTIGVRNGSVTSGVNSASLTVTA